MVIPDKARIPKLLSIQCSYDEMDSSIYSHLEDSYLMQETLINFLRQNKFPKNIRILDMGSGSGIQALTCKKLGFRNITAVDINAKSVKLLKKRGIKAVKSNLFSSINKNNRFDLIIFNPPYLPEDKKEPKDSQQQTTAGKKGYEIITKFLKQAKNYLTKDGTILLLFSTFSRPKIILQQAEKLKYKYEILSEKKLFFEILFVYKLNNN